MSLPEHVRRHHSSLKDVLRDEHKVLAAILELAGKSHKEYHDFLAERERNPENKMGFPIGLLRTTFDWLECGTSHLWEIMRDAYSHPPGFEFDNPKNRAHLRQTQRLLNLSARVIGEAIAASRSCPTNDKENVAKLAESLAESMRRRICDENGPRLYRHPDAERWFHIHARTKRRIAELWIESARRDEEAAAARKPVELPVRIVSGEKWHQLEPLGFHVVAEPSPENPDFIKVLLPVGWRLDKQSGEDSVRIRDRQGRVRATALCKSKTFAPFFDLLSRYQLREVFGGAEERTVEFQIVDYADDRVFDTTRKVAVPGIEQRKVMEQRLAQLLSVYDPFKPWPEC